MRRLLPFTIIYTAPHLVFPTQVRGKLCISNLEATMFIGNFILVIHKIRCILVCLSVCWLNLAFAQYQISPAGSKGPSEPSKAGFNELKGHFRQYVDDGVFAGTSLLLSQKGEVLVDLYGWQNREAGLPITLGTIFRIASMTKPITSVAVMLLVEEGLLGLDDPVEKYVPAFKNVQVYRSEGEYEPTKNLLTVRHLLTHTGGISSGFDPSPAGRLCADAMRERKPKDLKELVAVLAEVPLSFQPGEGWVYSYSTDVLAYIVEQVSGLPIDRFMAERIFIPLKMTDTGFQVPPDKIDRFAALYATGPDGKLALADDPESSPYIDGTYIPRGNGGLTSTIPDYFRFASMLLHGGVLDGVRILQPESVRLMTRNHIPDHLLPIKLAGQPLNGYGFGLGVAVLSDDPPFGEAGEYFWPGATYTYFFVNPEKEAIGIFMAQLSDMDKRSVLEEFHDLASKVLMRSNP